MKVTPVDGGAQRTWIILLDQGEEVLDVIRRVAAAEGLRHAAFTAVGALGSAVLGCFDYDREDWLQHPVLTPTEVMSLSGDVTTGGADGPGVHARAVLALADASIVGGWLLFGEARPKLEIVLSAVPDALARTFDDASRLPLVTRP
jgi:predicted DNA-binding protein with PD1-like motif